MDTAHTCGTSAGYNCNTMFRTHKAPSVLTTEKAVRPWILPRARAVRRPVARCLRSCSALLTPVGLGVALGLRRLRCFVRHSSRPPRKGLVCRASWPLGAVCQLRTSESPYRVHAWTPPHSILSHPPHAAARPPPRAPGTGPGRKPPPLRPGDQRMHVTSEGTRDHKMHARLPEHRASGVSVVAGE